LLNGEIFYSCVKRPPNHQLKDGGPLHTPNDHSSALVTAHLRQRHRNEWTKANHALTFNMDHSSGLLNMSVRHSMSQKSKILTLVVLSGSFSPKKPDQIIGFANHFNLGEQCLTGWRKPCSLLRTGNASDGPGPRSGPSQSMRKYRYGMGLVRIFGNNVKDRIAWTNAYGDRSRDDCTATWGKTQPSLEKTLSR